MNILIVSFSGGIACLFLLASGNKGMSLRESLISLREAS